MPRNIGTGLYKVPAGTDGVPDTTIESVKYNTYIHDVEKDLNDPRPILAGGTGANDANEALVNLRGEKAAQLVSSFADHLFYNGSFYCTSNTTDAPTTGAFTGWAISSDNPQDPPLNQNVVLYARSSRKSGDGDEVGRIYVREKIAGTWTPWTINATGVALPSPPDNPPDGTLWWDSIGGALYIWYNDGDTKQWVITSPTADPRQFLLKAGDTMQGNLGLASTPVNTMDAANKGYVDSKVAAVPIVDISGKVNKTGDTMSGGLTATGGINAPGGISTNDISVSRSSTPNAGAAYFGNTGTKYLYYDGTKFNLSSALDVSGEVRFSGDPVALTSVYRFVSSGSDKYLWWTGSSFSLNGGQLSVNGNIGANGQVSSTQNFQSSSTNVVLAGSGGTVFLRPHGAGNGTNEVQVRSDGFVQLFGVGSSFMPPHGTYGGFNCKDGVGQSLGIDYFNILWVSPYAYFYIDQTQLGIITINGSDYRFKKDIAPLPSTWDAVKALKPVKYSHKEFTPPSGQSRAKETGKPFFANDDTERWGFIAHEVQETLVHSSVHGEKDAPDKIQCIDNMTIVSALTKSLQEAMTRIEQLEARVAALEV